MANDEEQVTKKQVKEALDTVKGWFFNVGRFTQSGVPGHGNYLHDVDVREAIDALEPVKPPVAGDLVSREAVLGFIRDFDDDIPPETHLCLEVAIKGLPAVVGPELGWKFQGCNCTK